MTVRAETEVTLTRVNDGDNGVKVFDGTAGSVVTVSNASEYPALELVADIIPIQDGSGTPAPDNIRPIYGHDHCDVIVSPTLLDTDGTTYTTDFPQTVYGGTLDVVKGTLTVTYALMTFDGTQTFTDRISAQNRVYLQLGGMASQSGLNDDMVLCNALPKATGVQNADHPCIAVGVNNAYVYIQGVTHISGVTNLATLNTWLSNNPITFTYKLATPIVYSVSPKDIELITGTCNVWATTGDITDFRYAEISNDTLTVLDKVNADIKKTSQYFWHEQTGAEAGAHITEIPQEEFEANPSGGNLLATSNGIAVRDGLTDKAIYSGDGVILYAENNVVGFQILTTGSTSEQTVMLIVNKRFPANKTTSAVITELATVASSKKIIVRIRDAGNPIYGDTIQFTKGTSATHTSTYSFIVDYDGDQTFSVTNNRSGELTMPDVRYQMTLPTPDIRIRDITLTNGTWYCESKIKLWENPSPNSSWSGDLTSSDIDLSILALCDEVEMYYLFTTSPNYYVMSTRASVMHNGVGDMGSTGYMVVANNTSNRTGGRTFQVNDASGVTISSASYNGSTNNAYAIPWKIVGIKRI